MKAIKILLFLLVFSVLLIAVYFSGFFYYTKITPCLPPPNIHPDGKVYTVAFAWEDQNRDGYYDDGEPAMPNVVITHPLTLDVTSATNDKGLAETIEYKGGCPCNCWQGAYVEVMIPQGYVATNETKQLLTGENQTLLFGFAKAN